MDASGASAVACTVTHKAATPYKITRFKAVRSGSSVTFTWWPTTQDTIGGGWLPGDSNLDEEPFPYDGDLYYQDSIPGNPNDQYIAATTLTISYAGAFTAEIRQRRAGFEGSKVSLVVGASDGTYIGPDV